MAYTFDKSMKLFERAAKVIPGGIYGHQSPALTVPGKYPYYVAKASGAYFWDVDGNKFIDYMCAYGPVVLGYNHPKVEEAVAKQRKKGVCFNVPGENMVELAELMCHTIDGADWVVFAKNGSDVTTWATRVAREHTGRRKILACKGAYHGAHAWCSPGHGGLLPEDRAHVHLFDFNDILGLESLIRKFEGDVAGIIMTPYHHPAFGDSVMPADGFWQRVRSLCDKHGIVLIVDDVRAGFRLSIHGSHEYFGFEADLVAFSKAMGNGYPISACTGKEELRAAAGRVFLTGSFWNNADAMAASIATITTMKEEGTIERMDYLGGKLREGLEQAAESHGLKVRMTGPNAMPNMTFANETDFKRMQLFCAECAINGVYFHPHHNWFINSALTEQDLEQTLDVADKAFKRVKDTFGS